MIIVAAAFAEAFVRGSLIVDNNPAATATKILAHPLLYRLGGAADLVAFACDVAVAVLFYKLFKPVSPSVSLLAAFFRLMHVSTVVVATFFHFAPLYLLGNSAYLSVFRQAQLQALVLLSLRMHGLGYNIALIFFGLHCILIGYLLLRAIFLPKFLGILAVLAGICYLTNSFVNLLAPPLQHYLYPYILLPGAFAELSLCLWLLVAGVNVSRWKIQADAVAVPLHT